MIVVKCKKCGTLYTYKLMGIVCPGKKSPKSVECPECKEVAYHIMTSLFVVNEKVRKKKESSNLS